MRAIAAAPLSNRLNTALPPFGVHPAACPPDTMSRNMLLVMMDVVFLLRGCCKLTTKHVLEWRDFIVGGSFGNKLLPPSSILTLIKMLPTQKQTTCLYSALPGYPLPQPTTNGAVPFPCQSPSLLYTSPTKPSQSPFFPCTSPDDHLPNPKPFFQTRSLDLHGSEV